jgi:hypothetical protein
LGKVYLAVMIGPVATRGAAQGYRAPDARRQNMQKITSPHFTVDDLRREAECCRVFDTIARTIVISATNAGWREGEAALALADAAERYVLYLASPVRLHLLPANSNSPSGPD